MTNSYCQLGSIKKTGSERLGIFIGLILILNNISFVPSLASIYYAIMFISLLFLLFQSRNIQINGIMIWLYIACIVSILLNKVPNLFHPYQRFVSFFIMSILLSPFMISDTLTRFRTQAFTTILYLLQYVIILSVIFRIFGQGYDKGYFQGITTHSMMLGPFSALCTLYCILQILNGPPGKIKKIFYWVLVALSLFCLLQAASRTAFIAGIVSALVFLTVFYKDNIGRYFKRIVVLAVILVVSFPLWDQYLDKLQEKNEGGTTTLSLNSREIYWQTRIREFESSPFFGIGFASVDIDNTEGSTFNAADGKVESAFNDRDFRISCSGNNFYHSIRQSMATMARYSIVKQFLYLNAVFLGSAYDGRRIYLRGRQLYVFLCLDIARNNIRCLVKQGIGV